MDSLSELVRLLSPSGTVDLHCRVAGAWSAHNAQAPAGHMPYHVILDGRADVTIGKDVLPVSAGDVLLFPRGAAHTLASAQRTRRSGPPRGTASQRFNGVVTEITVPGADAPLDILCGTFALGGGAGILLRALPEMLCVPTAGPSPGEGGHDAGWLRGLIGMMHAEAETPRPGGAAIIADLSTALFTVLLRTLISRGTVTRGVLALLADTRMAKAVDAVVGSPERPWTIESLAQSANVSRATLARRFTQLGGITPLELVTTLRMERAARLLQQDNLSAAAVAERCGYASQAAFGRAFSGQFGVGPGAYRRQQRALRTKMRDAV
ncbi:MULTISPECIES: AraC family transcriptional regulator [Cupriavidus]|uniref:Transcriptional regulator, AraC family n=1 Tax=Cupriavidus pinatubonensis (strain JMP 134 / LMG 1197) TaxID=264198 RepID=Q46N37_CUPPJ|nr:MULTISPECIES: AraC family transcriptional regulator [Cupriavidus]QYY34081.1 AraC family transcriptional regulator [Cupriavidus pinatubonensis]TPQ28566.1 AraC family transcriptional regulator [Cupriavidus pinatubonensis]